MPSVFSFSKEITDWTLNDDWVIRGAYNGFTSQRANWKPIFNTERGNRNASILRCWHHAAAAAAECPRVTLVPLYHHRVSINASCDFCSLPEPFKDQCTVSSDRYISNVQCHTGLTYHFQFPTFGHSALRAERKSAQVSEIKNGRLGLHGIV